jgi:predicted anti-sigma-YlaC factor YlaD
VSDHLSDDEISNYRQRRSTAEVLLRVDDHISHCANCRQRIAQAHDIASAVRRTVNRLPADTSGPANDHLTYEQLEAYVDDTMSDSERELVRSHMGACQECAGELRDLNNFKAELSSPVDANRGQRTQRPPAVSQAPASPRTGPVWLTSRRAAAAAAAALALGSVLTFVWKKESQSPPQIPSTVAATGTALDRPGGKPVEQERAQPGSLEPDSRTRLATEMAALPPDERRAVSEAIERGEIKLPSTLEELRGRPQTLLGGSHDVTRSVVLEPTGEVVMDTQPLFHWQPVAGARSYSVAVFDTSLSQIQHSPVLQVTQWKADRPLVRGRVYLWQLTATMHDGTTLIFPAPPAPEAKLEVLQKEKADQLEQFRRSHPNAHLVLGILYARAGMLTPARLELQRITPPDPDYATAQHLLERTAEFGGTEH